MAVVKDLQGFVSVGGSKIANITSASITMNQSSIDIAK